MLSLSAQSAISTGADSVCDSPLQTSRSLALSYLFVSFFNRKMLALVQLCKCTLGWVLILAPWPSTEILQITSKEHEAVFQTGAHN